VEKRGAQPRATSVSSSLLVRNRQRTHRLEPKLLRRIITTLLRELLDKDQFDLGIFLVTTKEMTRLNETFLKHKGTTDVIAFDYAEPAHPAMLRGEVCVCIDEAQRQGTKFRTSWQSELVRYIVHGVLHLCGYRDHTASARRKMKRVEDRLLRQLAGRFPLAKLRRRRREETENRKPQKDTKRHKNNGPEERP